MSKRPSSHVWFTKGCCRHQQVYSHASEKYPNWEGSVCNLILHWVWRGIFLGKPAVANTCTRLHGHADETS